MKTKSGREIIAWVVREGKVREQGRYVWKTSWTDRATCALWGVDNRDGAVKRAEEVGGRVVPIVKKAPVDDDSAETLIANLTERFSKVEQDNFRLRAQIRRLEPLPVPDVNDDLARELCSWKSKAKQMEGALKLYEQSDFLVSKACDLIDDLRANFDVPADEDFKAWVERMVSAKCAAQTSVLAKQEEIDRLKSNAMEKKFVLDKSLAKLAERLPEFKDVAQRIDNEIWAVIKMNRDFG